jgi:type II secretory pathway pseudopilin PulG
MAERSRGVTLVEIAVILVVIGVLVGIGVGIVSLLIRNTKFNESREVVKGLKEAVVGYVITRGKLPCDGAETCDPPERRYTEIGRALDAWGQTLVYTYWGQLRDTADLCAETATGITLKMCGDDPNCTTPLQTVQNVAFIILSKGDNRNKQTAGEGRTTSPLEVRVWDFGTNADDDLNDGDASAEGYDDIVVFMTLEELKERYGCEGEPAPVTCVPGTSPIVVYNMSNYSLCFNGDKLDPGDTYKVEPGDTVEVRYFEGEGGGGGFFIFTFTVRFICGSPEGSFSYNDALSADANENCLVNYDGGGNLSDR